MKILLFISVFILIMISGCKEDSPTEPEEFEITISGKVVDESGNAVENCEINLVVGKTSLNTKSDFEGFFQFSFISSFPDSFRIVTKMEDYLDQTILYQNLTEDEMRNLQVVLSSKYITISGVLTEIDENGEHPSVNTLVKFEVVIGDVHFYEIVTDQIGNFNLQVDKTGLPKTEIDEIVIEIEKQGYESLLVFYIQPNDSIIANISLQITKIVNYFPIKVGNRWEYEYRYVNMDAWYPRTFKGTEIWNISSVENNNFTLEITFSGTEIRYSGYDSSWNDTLYIDNNKTSYNLRFNDGYIEGVGDTKPPKNLTNIDFKQILTSNGIYLFESEESFDPLNYLLTYGIGISHYYYRWRSDVSGGEWELKLLNFTDGG